MATTPRRLFAAQQLQARVRTAAQSGRYEAVRRAQSARDVAAVALRSASKMLKLSLEVRARQRREREHTQPGSCASAPPAAHDPAARATSVTQARDAAADALPALDSQESHPCRARLKLATGAATAYILLSRAGSDLNHRIDRLWTPCPGRPCTVSFGETGNGGGRLHSHAAPAALPAPIERRSYPPCGSLLGRLRRSISDPEMSLTPDITSGAQASQASASAEASTVYSDVGAGQRQGRREFPSTLGLPLDRQAQKSRLQRFEREVLVRGSRAVSTVGGHFRQRHLSARSLRDSTGRTLSF